jgi:uncharacterized damage-inducible protein DinB
MSLSNERVQKAICFVGGESFPQFLISRGALSAKGFATYKLFGHALDAVSRWNRDYFWLPPTKKHSMSNSVDLIKRLHQHRAWVNQNLLAAAAQLNCDQQQKVFAIGQGSIWKSLLHLYGAEFVWLEALLGNENALVPGDLPQQIPGNQLGPGAIASLDELRSKWSDVQQRWDRYLSTLTADSLDDTVYRTRGNGQRFGARRSDVLLHVCTHDQYTAAQTVNMFRQLGVEKLPDTMLMAMARQETAAR